MKKRFCLAWIMAAVITFSVPIQAASVNAMQTETRSDVSGGDVSGGDVSGGDVSGGDAQGVKVQSIQATGAAAICPQYVYPYKVSFTPANATDKTVSWHLENESIAEIISVKGDTCYVRGIAEGKTNLVAVSKDGGHTSKVSISVSKNAPISNEFISGDYTAIKEVLKDDSVNILEYRVTGSTKVSETRQKEVYSNIKGKDKKFTFSFADKDKNSAYKWSFNGTNIKNTDKTVDFNIVINPDNPSVINCVDKGIEEVDLHFSQEGELPGEAMISVAVSKYINAEKLYLYYYNPAISSLELVTDNVLMEDGFATFSLSHCSDYILTATMLRSLIPVAPDKGEEDTKQEDTKKQETVSNTEVRSPKTGDANLTGVFVILGSVTAGVVLFWKKARKKNKIV